MDHVTDEKPALVDLLAKIDDRDTHDRHFLTDEVRFADLSKLSDANLEGRLTCYERDYTFELSKSKRAEFYREMIRTKIAIASRKASRRDEAVKTALAGEYGRVDFSEPSEIWKSAA